MSGSGHNHSFNTILHNNRLLLKRRNIFRKNDSFLDSRKAYLKAARGKIDLKSATKEELAELRKTVVRNRRMSFLKSWSIAILISVPIFFMSVQLYSYFTTKATMEVKEKEEHEAILKQEKERIILEKKTEEYDFLLSDGQNWLEKGKVDNAIHQYERAVGLFPDKFEANLRLVQAHFLKCQLENDNQCSEGNRLLKKIEKEFPNQEIIMD